MSLVVGVDSSTQSCTVVIRDAPRASTSGRDARRIRRAPRSTRRAGGTRCRPRWPRRAASTASRRSRWRASSTAWCASTPTGEVVRPALLWNDTRSAQAAADLVAELGAQEWADATGTLPVAAITAAKLRWLATHEPENAARTAAVCLPHDWLTWKLRGTGALDDLVTDRGDASGTGYFSAVTNSLPPRPAGTGFRPYRRRAAARARAGRGGRAHPRRRAARPRHRRQRGRRARARRGAG